MRLSGEQQPILRLNDYEAIGGGTLEALGIHAEQIFHELKPDQQRIAEILFRALTDSGGTTHVGRRPVRLHEAMHATGGSFEDLSAVVDAFRAPGRHFLYPPPDMPLEPYTIIDICHEALIRQWPRLRAWAKDESEAGESYRQLLHEATLSRRLPSLAGAAPAQPGAQLVSRHSADRCMG